jgi:hypothetical protein
MHTVPSSLRVGERFGRAGNETLTDHPIDDPARLKGEDRLALGGAIGGLAHPDIRAHADRLRAFQIADIHDLAAIEDRQMHRLVGLLAPIIEIRPRLVRHVHAPAHQRAQPEQRDAELIFPALAVLLEQALGDQRDGSRWAVLLAMPRRRASALIPISTSCSEKAFSKRVAVATEDSRPRPERGPLGSADLGSAGFFLVGCGTMRSD